MSPFYPEPPEVCFADRYKGEMTTDKPIEPHPRADARFRAGFNAGQEDERKRIVAWLRERASGYSKPIAAVILNMAADKLEKETAP